jgi:hypothetical protein
MLSFAHTLISLPLGLYLENPFIIFIAAFTLHLASDVPLHWNIYPQNYKRYPYELVALDIIGGFVAVWLLIGEETFHLPVIAAIAGGNMPDIMHTLWDNASMTERKTRLKIFEPFFIFHEKIQRETPSPLKGLISQVILVVLALGAVALRL